HFNFPPRTLGPYVERRSSGHNIVIETTGKQLAKLLVAMDRKDLAPIQLDSLRLGAQPEQSFSPPSAAGSRTVKVSSAEQLRQAMVEAQANDVITLTPGVYRFK